MVNTLNIVKVTQVAKALNPATAIFKQWLRTNDEIRDISYKAVDLELIGIEELWGKLTKDQFVR